MAEETADLKLVYDVPVNLQVMLGDTTLTIGEVLQCQKGSVIPLRQKVGDPFRIYLESRVIAEGEVVDAGGQLGIRITQVISPETTPEVASEAKA